MANQSVGTPRFWIDFTQLAKAKGFFNDITVMTEGEVDNTYKVFEGETSDDAVYPPYNMNVWNFDYTNPTSYLVDNYTSYWGFKLGFWDFRDASNANLEWAKLISTVNFAGIINHNIKTNLTSSIVSGTGNSYMTAKLVGLDADGNKIDIQFEENRQGIFASGHIIQDGYSFVGLTLAHDIYAEGADINKLGSIQIQVSTDGGSQVASAGEKLPIEIGAYCFGKYIDMPHSPDLSVKKSVEYDGVNIKRSLGGADFVQINHQGQPDWLVGEPWTLKNYASNGRVGRNGRRSWDLSFSYISNDDLFYDLKERVVGGSATIAGVDETAFDSTDEIQQIWDLTLGGALSFVFTPDKDATNPEFAVCKLDQDSLVATQVAFQTWNISMRVVEVW